jgi:hypothetical protein
MVEYGITTSEAFIWAHVCHLDASIYWYLRADMLVVLERYPPVEIRSARGHKVRLHGNVFPQGFIHDAELGYEFFKRWKWIEAASDREAGAWAEECFAVAVRERRLTLPMRATRYDNVEDQRKGKDFRCEGKYDVETKADVPGGVWGTGNLFVQTHELHHQHGERNGHRKAA